jgi:hypothetical protein
MDHVVAAIIGGDGQGRTLWYSPWRCRRSVPGSGDRRNGRRVAAGDVRKPPTIGKRAVDHGPGDAESPYDRPLRHRCLTPSPICGSRMSRSPCGKMKSAARIVRVARQMPVLQGTDLTQGSRSSHQRATKDTAELQETPGNSKKHPGTQRNAWPTRASIASLRGTLGCAPATVQASEPAASPR